MHCVHMHGKRRKYAHLLRWCAEAAMQQVELCGALGVLLLLA